MPIVTKLFAGRLTGGVPVAGLALALANTLLPPGVMDAAAPLWDWACVAVRQLRGAVLPA